MTKLQLHDEIKAREATKQFAATYNVRMEFVGDMDSILTVLYNHFNAFFDLKIKISSKQNSCSLTSGMSLLKLTVFRSWMLLSRVSNLPLMEASWLLWTEVGPRSRPYPFMATAHTTLACKNHVHQPSEMSRYVVNDQLIPAPKAAFPSRGIL